MTDPDPANNSATDTDTLTPQADLSITKTDGPTRSRRRPADLHPHGPQRRPGTATGVSVSDPLPASVSLVSATASQGGLQRHDTVSCALGSLASGASATVVIVVTPGSPGPLSNSATVASSTADPVTANNTAGTTTTVEPPATGQPRLMKQAVLADLIAFRATVSDKEDGHRLDEAIKHLQKSLDAHQWIDASHLQRKGGEKVFEEEKHAVKKLGELLKHHSTSVPGATLQGWIDRLVAVDRMLAAIAINEAGGGDPGNSSMPARSLPRATSRPPRARRPTPSITIARLGSTRWKPSSSGICRPGRRHRGVAQAARGPASSRI